ncbi:hypothetical protein DVH05_000398 [Phytophthora capsici]|nr:hypothetical protein DVH05_000398 [Phytophthora capsici]
MAEMLEPAVHLFMDASNEGLAVLYPAAREYIRLQFDEEERLAMKLSTSGSTSWFSINDIPTEFRKIYKQKLPSCNGSRSPTRHAKGISTHGDNGVGSAVVMASTSGYHLLTQKSNPYNSLCLQLSAGKAVTRTRIIELTPYGLNSAMSDGVISFVLDSDRHYNHNTSWSSMACNGSVPLDGNVQQSPSACFARSPQQPTCPSPSTG